MFHTVQLKPGDSAKELAALGLKLKRKQGHNYILQPCPAFKESCCSIYAARPQRCRLFECRQLKRVEAGEITEAIALEKIREVQRRVAELDELLQRSGGTNLKRPLSKRFEKVMAEPTEALTDPAAVELRKRLTLAKQDLDVVLNQDFRIMPSRAGEDAGSEPKSE
jgi:Fe-S-cluster containining protein